MKPLRLPQQIWKKFLKIFGDIKVFKWPFFCLYDPGSYRVKGRDMRQVINLIKPGDVLVRGYSNYLDGFFIPGYFSHAGLYLGPVKPTDAALVTLPEGKTFFRSGEQMVVHAMAEGVFMEDVLDFCRCDMLVIMRFPEQLDHQHGIEPTDEEKAKFTLEENDIFERIEAGESVSFAEIFPMVYKIALSQVGKPYDFGFNFENYNDLSCTEYVYFCTKSFEGFHGLRPKKKRVLFVNKPMLTPDGVVASNLDLIWQNALIDTKKLAKLRGAEVAS